MDLTDDKSTLVCLAAPSHCLNQCWPRALTYMYGVNRPHWVKLKYRKTFFVRRCFLSSPIIFKFCTWPYTGVQNFQNNLTSEMDIDELCSPPPPPQFDLKMALWLVCAIAITGPTTANTDTWSVIFYFLLDHIVYNAMVLYSAML